MLKCDEPYHDLGRPGTPPRRRSSHL